MKRDVLSVKRSPQNSHEWLLKLGCGHELTIQTNGYPTGKKKFCWKCKRGLP